MAKCPKCSEEISHLTNVVGNITETYSFQVENGEPEYEYLRLFSGASRSVYECPKCLEIVAKDEEEAIKILQSNEGE